MPEECGIAEPCRSASRLMYILAERGGGGEGWIIQQVPSRSSPSCTQAAPDHPAFTSGPAGTQGGQSHRQFLEARLCVLVEHLSRLVHDLEPAVLLDGCVHIMLQESS